MRKTGQHQPHLPPFPSKQLGTSSLRKLLPLTLALSLGMTGCGGGGGDGGGGGVQPDPPRATSMTVSPSTLALTFLGEVTRLAAAVRDQNG